MPRGYRCILVAFIGWLSLAAANQPAKHADSQKDGGKTQTAVPSWAAYPELYSGTCYHAKDHEAADLCAQWRAALAAEKAAHESRRATTWSIIATFFGLATIAGLIITIIQTFGALGEARRGNLIAQKANARATRQALAGQADTKRAVDSGERNALATAELVRVSHDNARKQLRAYLDFDEVDWLRDESRDLADKMFVGIKYSVKNFGQTPAQQTFATITYESGALNAPPQFVGTATDEIGMISPTDHVTKNGYFHIPTWLWAAIAVRKTNFFATIEVTYVDSFDAPHSLKSRFESDGPNTLGFIPGTRSAD